MNLSTPLKSVSRITPRYAEILEKMALTTVRDFLFYFPFRYDDFRRTVPISDEFVGQVVTIEGQIKKTRLNRIWKRRMTVLEIVLEDQNGTALKAVWFNQPYILESLPQGTTVRLAGKLNLDGKFFSMNSPSWEKSSRDTTNTGRLVPIYPETKGLTSKWIRWQMKMFLPLAKNIPDILPYEIRKKYNLYDIYTALSQIHFPDSKEFLIRAQKRRAFEEMFLVQLKTLQIKKDWEGKNSLQIKFDEKLIKNFVGKLPFKLTDAQRKAAYEILKDLEKEKPMNRLLNGDVGSGKTVVAAVAALETMSAGHQVAIMAPTEVLARQHYFSFCELFKNYDFNIALLTNSYKLMNCHPERSPYSDEVEGSTLKNHQQNHNKDSSTTLRSAQNDRKKLLKNIVEGKINLVIGTHALIQKDVKFKNLALVVIDEQHRFGVAQRAALQQEAMTISDGINSLLRESASGLRKSAVIPHLLTMTATPIPRTLAIAFFGSLDLSLLDEMPKNRLPITTKIITPNEREKIYEFIKNEIKKGRQVFVIFPLVEESKLGRMVNVRAATEEHKRLSEKIFPKFRLGLLHGRLKAKEKEKTMKNFSDKKLDILVSTSVVEVGVDISNASIMVIENAERFGLTQLHQFRGRVGRGSHQSYCFLFTEKKSERLKTLEETNDGFKISEKDLELRGPGQFFGLLQSGIPDIAMENLSNVKLIKFAREEAQNILNSDPKLKKNPLLADTLKKFSDKIHLE